MKTISEIIREIFAVRGEKPKIDEKSHEKSVEKPDMENGKQATDEEPIKSEDDTANQNQINQNLNNQNNEEYETENPEMDRNPDVADSDDQELVREIEAAYQRGVIDGRNSIIEERYFPVLDDGLPRFRGCQSKMDSLNDIFSMAREA